jgi:hypothetical protein
MRGGIEPPPHLILLACSLGYCCDCFLSRDTGTGDTVPIDGDPVSKQELQCLQQIGRGGNQMGIGLSLWSSPVEEANILRLVRISCSSGAVDCPYVVIVRRLVRHRVDSLNIPIPACVWCFHVCLLFVFCPKISTIMSFSRLFVE